MEISKLLSVFFDLLRFYEGVEVGDCHRSGGKQFVSLRITDPKSIVRLEYFCTAANVRSNIYAESLPTDADSIGNALRRLVLGIDFSEDGNNPGKLEGLEGFCTFMLRDLIQRGVLNQTESARFLSVLERASHNG